MDGRDGFRVVGVPIAADMPMQPSPISETPGPSVPIEQAASQSRRIFGRAVLAKWSANLSHAM